MTHEILGHIHRDTSDSGDGIAKIDYESRKTEIRIIPDDETFEATVKLAADVATRLSELDKTAKRIIVADMRGKYNSGWNEYDEVQEDGVLRTVSNPQLSETEFEKKFSLVAVNVTGSEMVELFYEDSGLFWGHRVIVCSFNGADFGDASAELFG